LPQPGSGAEDATVDGDFDAGAVFDSPILYADRVLPDIATPPETGTGGEAGPPWPNCPPWVPVVCVGLDISSPEACQGSPTPLGSEQLQVPAEYDDAGNVLVDDAGRAVLFPLDSGCGSYGWLGSRTIDNCASRTLSVSPDFPFLPPCNWCADAGLAHGGPAAGESRYDLCLKLYQCMMNSGCATRYPGDCLCGNGAATANCDASGPCAAEELAALESLSDPASIQAALLTYTSPSPTYVGYCGAALNAIFQGAGLSQGSCFYPDGG
jgi:hypothetical protein